MTLIARVTMTNGRAWSGMLALTALASIGVPTGLADGPAPARVKCIRGQGAYAVVVSRKTYEDKKWRNVVDALSQKHGATVIVFPASVGEAREQLADVFPRYTCFVARPEEAGRKFVVSVHRLTRALDEDPYTDVIWGILTGYDAAAALKIARHREPLLVRRAAAGCGLNLGAFEEGRWYSEGQKNVMWRKEPGGRPEKKRCPDDTTRSLVELLNTYKPDFFMTSGHATQRDWQIGYSYRNGQIRCAGGQLFGIDLSRRRYKVDSPNPKVYLAAGNCLAGLIDDRNTMALAWMRSAGVCQMVGYVVSTWHGYGGWGVRDIFVNQAGRFTLAEAFYLNNQSLVHELQSRFPRAAKVDFERWDMEKDRTLIPRLARTHKLRNKTEIGLLWDRDTVAFYGDPAWEARIKRVHEPAWRQTLTERDGTFTFTAVTRKGGSWSRPPMALLPHRVRDVKVLEGAEHSPLITDNFLLLPRRGKFSAGESFKVVFKARRR